MQIAVRERFCATATYWGNGHAVGVTLGPPVMAAIFDVTGSFELAFVYSTASLVISIVLALLIRTKALHHEFSNGEEPTAATAEA